MAKWIILLIVACMTLLCQFPVNAEKHTDEQSARQLLKELDDVYWTSAPLYRNYPDYTLSAEIFLREKMRPYYQQLQAYDWENFEDQQLRRQFEVILRGAKYPAVNRQFKKATKFLQSIAYKKWVCSSVFSEKCPLVSANEINSIFVKSDKPEELKYYWKEWRNKMPDKIKDALQYYIDYYRNMSTPTMKASDVWYDQQEDTKFNNATGSLMIKMMPLYRELHAHLRHVLRVKYGDKVVTDNGLIPHYLLEQVMHEAAMDTSVLGEPFPENLPNMYATIDNADLDMVNIGAKFFDSLGMEQLSEEFKQVHIKPIKQSNRASECNPRLFTMGDTELNYCTRLNYNNLLQIHGDLTQIHYALAKNNNGIGLNQEACPGFGNIMAQAVILSASTPHYLQQKLKLLDNYVYDRNLKLNRLYRKAVQSLFTFHTNVVHELLWVDMINGKVAPDQVNCHYWNLMQEYMGVEAPMVTDAKAYDMPYTFYEGIIDQSKFTKKITSEFLGYEIYRTICLATGDFQPGNENKTLDLCDFADKEKAGSLLSKWMHVGSRDDCGKTMRDVISNSVNGTNMFGIFDYFETLSNWLKVVNRNKNLQTGWASTEGECLQ